MGIEGSPVKSHSRNASLDTLAPFTPCFVDFVREKRLSTVFRSSPVSRLYNRLVQNSLQSMLLCYELHCWSRESGSKNCLSEQTTTISTNLINYFIALSAMANSRFSSTMRRMGFAPRGDEIAPLFYFTFSYSKSRGVQPRL